MSDRGGSTNSPENKFGKINKGNPAGPGGATHEYKGNFGPIGTYSLDKGSTNNGNAKTNVGKPASS